MPPQNPQPDQDQSQDQPETFQTTATPPQSAPPQEAANPAQKPLASQNRQNTPPQKQPDAKKSKDDTTQKSLLVSEIRDGIVIMQDGSLRAVVMCQSINFDLMSPQEREGVEFSYQQFLNSLDFSIQIFIRSQHINLDEYLEKLEKTKQNQDNILLGLLMEDYIAYVRYLVEAANIMDKQFYVVIPYYPSALSADTIASGARKFTELFKPQKKDVVTINEVDFRKYKQELTQRVRVVSNGLTQIGVQAIPLNTQELIELYYNVYNPVTAKQEPLTDVNQLNSAMIEKGEGESKQVLPGDSP